MCVAFVYGENVARERGYAEQTVCFRRPVVRVLVRSVDRTNYSQRVTCPGHQGP